MDDGKLQVKENQYYYVDVSENGIFDECTYN